MLEDRFGHEIVHFAYPFGSFDTRVRALVAEAGYRTACTVEIGLSTSEDHPLALRRVPVTGHDTLVDFVARLGSGRTTIEWVGGVVRRLRRAELGRDSKRDS
jgi:peptidoglycan/xylan/chitin deacetylase (PgdA/CDA1 family)